MIVREKQLIDTSGELTRYILSPNCDNKEHAFYCLRVLAMCKGLVQLPKPGGSLPPVMSTHLEVLKYVVSISSPKNCEFLSSKDKKVENIYLSML